MELGPAAAGSAATGGRPSHNVESYDKVQAVTRIWFFLFQPKIREIGHSGCGLVV